MISIQDAEKKIAAGVPLRRTTRSTCGWKKRRCKDGFNKHIPSVKRKQRKFASLCSRQIQKHMTHRFSASIFFLVVTAFFFRCGQPVPPTGGKRDSLAPRLVRAMPADSAVNMRSNRIILEFDEYVQLQNLQQQLVVSPVPSTLPQVDAKLKIVTIKLKDSLQPNTTYALNFGNALQDINENNPLPNFTYVFSTGSQLDTAKISGRVLLAETGKADSTIIVVLHNNLSDTAFQKLTPKYFARLNKEGFFTFRFVVPGTYNLYAIKDGVGLRYDSPKKVIAFLNKPVEVGDNSEPVKLYAYEEKDTTTRSIITGLPKVASSKDDKRLKFQTNLETGTLDILGDLLLRFERNPTKFDTAKIRLTDEQFNRIPDYRLRLDSSTASIQYAWKPGTKYALFIEKGLAEDSLGNQVLKTDTLRFESKKEADYGSLLIRANNLDTSKRPVLMFFVNDTKKRSLKINQARINIPLIQPGDYELRILFDTNGNGIWDPGEFSKKIQPEIVIPRKQRLNIRANWDNEVEIDLQEVMNQG
jgi:hypothetical protein